MSIHWIRNILIDGDKQTLDIHLGSYTVSDKCYTRIGDENPHWFKPSEFDRDYILNVGIEKMKSRLEGKKLTYINGEEFDWK